jgi:hypothetical protein
MKLRLAPSSLALACTLACALLAGPASALEIAGPPERFAPDVASTSAAEVRLTLSPDGRTALWFSRDRRGGPGGYDIWMSRRDGDGWGPAAPVPFNSPGRDFDPAFSSDGRFVYFSSDRPGGRGGDDVWRVAVSPEGFGRPENLGPTVNSAGNEWAPMLGPGGERLLFSSDRPGGQGRQDLYVAVRDGQAFGPAAPIQGVNTAGDEFDATFLADGRTVVFARAADLSKDRIDLFQAAPTGDGYGPATRLPEPVNDPAKDTYGAMLDWSRPDRLIYAADRGAGMDLYTVAYRPDAAPAPAPAPALADGGRDFDFLIGNWTARLRQLEKPLTGSTTWTEYRGISRHRKLLDTNANFEEFAVESLDGTKRKKGQTLRLYNPKTREWSIYLLDLDNGLLPLPPVVGSFHGGVGEFLSHEAWNGRTILVRYQWTPRGRDAAHMEQAFSVDGGRTWEANWILDLTRER